MPTSTAAATRPAPPTTQPPVQQRPPGPLARWWRGRGEDPAWVRPALLALLVATAGLYLWGLGASGTANTYYAAAVQAASQSTTAWLFGSLDASNFITVDKPPASLWVMGLSARLLGFGPWPMLAPQALMGVGTVGLLYATVRRWAGPGAGLLAGALLAVTPVAVLMFRFNNPDALLVLTLVAASWAVVRAIDAGDRRAATGWMVAAGTLVGLGFLTKMLQAFLVLPALGAVFLLAAAGPWRTRLVRLGAAAAAVVVSIGWYVALVDLWPTGSRPYIGGSTDNTLLDLVLGYNGLGRILGGDGNGGGAGGPGGGAGGPGGGGGFGGTAGITRLFNSEFGGQIAWLLPAALVALVAGLWLRRGAPRTDRTRAALVLWGGSLLVTGLVFSFMGGTIHAYYAVALAPAIAALVAVGGRELWLCRDHLAARITMAATLAGTAAWSVVLLRRSAEFLPWLRWVVAVAGVLAAVAALLPPGTPRAGASAATGNGDAAGRRAMPFVLVTALVAGLVGAVTAVAAVGGPVAYAAQTAATAHQGSIVLAGPSTGVGGPGGGPGGAGGPGGGTPPAGARPDGQAGQGGPGGATTSAELSALLGSADTRWAAATVSAQSAAGMQLASGSPVMAIGGFSGSDAAPSLAQFQAWVAQGDVHWFVAGSGGGPGGDSGVGAAITEWVAAHYTPSTVGGSTVYDLTTPID